MVHRMRIARKREHIFSDFETIYDTADCSIHFKENCDSDLVILSFTGIGHSLGGIDIQQPEFLSSLNIGSVYFIVDKKRSWGNNLDLTEISRAILRRSSNKRIFCVGNSMGGFLAILISSLVKAESVLAFAPQWSIDPEIVPFENRWMTYRSNITVLKYKDLSNSFAASTRYLTYFGTIALEKQHSIFFKHISNCETIEIDGADHNVASFLKSRGQLSEVFDKWING